jgi:hypothetical protein
VFYPFDLWGQPLRQIECVDLNGETVVIAAGGPPGAEVRVYRATDGTVRAEYTIGNWTNFQQRPHRVVRRTGGPALAIGIDHRQSPVPGLGAHFVRLLDPLSGAPIGPSLPSPDVVIGLHTYDSVLVVADARSGFTRFDPDRGEALPRLGGQAEARTSAVATAAMGQPLAMAGTMDGTLTMWDLAAGVPLWTDRTVERRAFALALATVGDSAYLAVARGAQYVEFRDALTGTSIAKPFALDGETPPRLALGEVTGRATLYVGNGERFDTLDAATGERIRPTREWPDEIAVMHLATVERRSVLFVVDDYVMCMLDAETGEVLIGWTER